MESNPEHGDCPSPAGSPVFRESVGDLVWVHGSRYAAARTLMAKRLHNYLRTYRKRAGLSQDEMAFLLGCRHGTKVSRYERNNRQPGLKAALAFEAVLREPVRELYAGLFEKVEAVIIRRARVLARKLSAATHTPHNARKLALLSLLTSGPVSQPGEHI